jgi:ribosomal protein L9
MAQNEVELDRRKIGLPEPIKELGTVEVPVQLHGDVHATLTIEVVAG